MAQQRSHVPKFGNWDKDNIPYTAYFENACKEKAGVRMNPNDPEENPEAFAYAAGGLEYDNDYRSIQAAPLQANKRQGEGQMRQNAYRINTSDHQQTGGNYKIGTPESGSDKSNSDQSLKPPSHRRLISDQRKGLPEGNIGSISTLAAGHSRQKSGGYASSNNTHHRTASVPKFGAWDEADPTSGEGYTVIFNKVKEEKQIASVKFPTVPSPPSNYCTDNKRKSGNSSSRSKICCCLFSSRRE